jgi:hypothetical protein
MQGPGVSACFSAGVLLLLSHAWMHQRFACNRNFLGECHHSVQVSTLLLAASWLLQRPQTTMLLLS